MATYWARPGAAGTNAGTQANPFNASPGAFAAALAAATSAGDVILYHYAASEELAADTTFTINADITIAAVDMDSSDALTPMGTGAWIGNSTTNRSVGLSGARKVLFSGMTFRIAGASADLLTPIVSDGADYTYEGCYLWQGCTSSSGHMVFGRTGGDANCAVTLRNTTLRFGATGQQLRLGARMILEGGGISSAGSAPTSLVFGNNDAGGATFDWLGGDLSHLTGNMLGDCTVQAVTVRLSQCKLGVFPPTIATQTVVNRGSAEVYAFDCATGDTHGLFAYVNPLGQVSSDTGIYFTSGAAAQSWKITTTAAATFNTPFETPWFGYYNTVTTAITPYLEILRDGSTTAYQDDEVWLDVAAKVTSGSTQATLYTSRMTLLGTPANNAAGAGLGSWTGESGTAWSGKIALGSSITPAEVGHIQARIVVGEPSVTVYADPQIRT
jgi:hypothetical protein